MKENATFERIRENLAYLRSIYSAISIMFPQTKGNENSPTKGIEAIDRIISAKSFIQKGLRKDFCTVYRINEEINSKLLRIIRKTETNRDAFSTEENSSREKMIKNIYEINKSIEFFME